MRCFAEKPESEEIESLFMKELKKRGIQNTPGSSDATSDAWPRIADLASPFGDDRSRSGATKTEKTPQLDTSRALNSEGLEGLIPRGSILLRLGGSFFLGFVPIIAAVFLATILAYVAFGDSFIHTGGEYTPGPPPYLDPYELLNEPTVDPYYPLQ